MGLCRRRARSSESASLQGRGKGVAFASAPFLFALVDDIPGFGRRFEEESEGEAGGVGGVADAAIVETREGGAGGDGEVEGGGEAVVFRIAGCGCGRGFLFAAAGGGEDGGRVEGEFLVGVCLEAQVERQIDGGSGLEVGEGSDGGVGLANARPDEAAGGADAEFNVWREDAEGLLEMIVEVVGGFAGAKAVGGVS